LVNELLDWRGNPINVGDTVVYPGRQSSLVWMNEGIVVEIKEKEISPYNKNTRLVVGVKPLCESRHGRKRLKDSNRVVWPEPNRLTVMGFE
jgi:hypothetical protein